MTRRRVNRLVRVVLVLTLGSVGLAPVATAETWVGYPALLSQVKSGPLTRAIINPQRGDVEIKFRDLSEWHAFYPAGAQADLQRLLYARHVRVLFVKRHPPRPAAPIHHHLRYVVAAAFGALAAIVACAFLLSRRRRERTAP